MGSLGDAKVYTVELTDQDRKSILSNKKWLEGQSDKIRSGEIGIRENGPSWSRPKPDRRFY